ncbi:MAG: hypothetical protein SO011_00585 [Prevotella sp.]|nr:hypothetical protein [Prevotella sp.]
MNKKMYETPSTKRSLVEMEGGICATSKEPIEDNKVNVTIDKQKPDDGFTATEWDK